MDKIDFTTLEGSFTLLSGWTSDTNEPLRVERWGKFIYIYGRINYSGNIPSADTQIGYISEGFRPIAELFETVMGQSGALARVIIRPNGLFSAGSLSGYNTNYLKFNDLYLAP